MSKISKNPPSYNSSTFGNYFFKLPKIENISTDPEELYNEFNNLTNGRLHGMKVKQIYHTILDGSTRNSTSTQIQNVLADHSITDELLNLPEEDVADFLRHVFYINRDHMGWDISDQLIHQLDNEYIPRWELPNQVIDGNFRYILHLIVDWELTPHLIDLIKIVQSKVIEYQEKGYHPTIFWSKPVENIRRWNVMMLSDLYETLNILIFTYHEIDEEKFSPLISQIERTFIQLLDYKNVTSQQKVVLELIFCHGLILKTINGVIKAKTRISEIWARIEANPELDEQQYHWIFGSFYCQIYANLIDFEIDIVTRKVIIADVVNNYLKPHKVDFEKWKKHILSLDMHPWTFSYKIRGYAEILYSLLDHAQDLVIEVNRDQILDYHKKLTSFLYEVLRDFTRKQGAKNNINEMNLASNISRLNLPISQIDIIQSTLFDVVKNYLLYQTELNTKLSHSLTVLNSSILTKMYNQQYVDIFKIDMQLNYKTEELQEIYNRIETELDNNLSLLESRTFEEMIIKKFSILFNLVVNETDQNFNRLHKYSLEVLLWYLSYWYWTFQENELAPIESKMILSPFIGLIMKNLAIYHYQHNQNTKAHLMLINNYCFQGISGLIDTENRYLKDEVSNTIEKFGNIYDQISFKLKETEMKLKDFGIQSVNSHIKKTKLKNVKKYHGYDIEPDAVLRYMDLRDNYHNFIKMSTKIISRDLVKVIHKSNLFTLPEMKSPILLRKIGKNISEDVIKEYPFPLIRNLHKFGIAIKLFPVSIQLSKFMIDMEL